MFQSLQAFEVAVKEFHSFYGWLYFNSCIIEEGGFFSDF